MATVIESNSNEITVDQGIYSLIASMDTIHLIRRSFVRFINYKNGKTDSHADDAISFWEGFLLKSEGYKADKNKDEDIYKKANNILKWSEWGKPSFDKSEIANRFIKVIDLKKNNLVNRYQKNFFKEKLSNDSDDSVKQALFDIYHSKNESDEKNAFEIARQSHIFGSKYDLLAFLFFLKNKKRFLPVRPSFFDDSFKILGINFEMAYLASWDNYQRYLQIVEYIRRYLVTYTTHKVSLTDAHSFLWIIQPNGTTKKREFLDFHEHIMNLTNTAPSENSASNGDEDSDESGYTSETDIDYIEQARRNKEIGDAGELYVFKCEQEKLRKYKIDKEPKLIAGNNDSAGYDILSYDESGTEIYIEVKTTIQGRDAEFYFSSNELVKSRNLVDEGKKYYLYRVYDFDMKKYNGTVWIHEGSLEDLDYMPATYTSTIP